MPYRKYIFRDRHDFTVGISPALELRDCMGGSEWPTDHKIKTNHNWSQVEIILMSKYLEIQILVICDILYFQTTEIP